MSTPDIAQLQKDKAQQLKIRAAVTRKDAFLLTIRNEGDLESLKKVLKGAGAFSVTVINEQKRTPKSKKDDKDLEVETNVDIKV